MLSAKIETSVNPVISRSTDIVPRIDITPTIMGRAAATRPPNTHTNTRKLNGTAIISMSSRSLFV